MYFILSYTNISDRDGCRFECANLDPSLYLMRIMKMRYTYGNEAI